MYTKRVCISNRVPVSKKRLSSEGWMMAPLFFFFSFAKFWQRVLCVCAHTCLFLCAFVHMLICQISDITAMLVCSSWILLFLSSPSFSLQQKRVLHDPLMQDYWIKEQGSCTNLPHSSVNKCFGCDIQQHRLWWWCVKVMCDTLIDTNISHVYQVQSLLFRLVFFLAFLFIWPSKVYIIC